MTQPRLRVIVVGLGAMGSAAAFQLARRGATVVGLETFGPAHDRGSSHGESRIIRKAYFEDPAYVPLVLRAYQLWRDLEASSGQRLLETTGGVMIGLPDGEMVSGSLQSALQWDLPHRILTASELQAEFPVFHPTPDQVGLVEPDAGVLAPELAVLSHLRLATGLGAELHFGERVIGWEERQSSVVVGTETSSYEVDRLVLTAGAWSQGLLPPGLEMPLQSERQVMVWFAPTDIARFTAPSCPIFLLERGDGGQFYGVPTRDGLTAKAARHHGGELTTAGGLRREIEDGDVGKVREGLAEIVPELALAPLARAATCLYTNTPDLNFVIGQHPSSERVSVAAGFSGHGFKFSPVVGEILADLVESGQTTLPIGVFSPARFGPHQSGGNGISGSGGSPTPSADITSPIT
ncbi:MAG: N-methyl-L-tryptophan oxidase [Candidatus Dormiibacterota bacterium]